MVEYIQIILEGLQLFVCELSEVGLSEFFNLHHYLFLIALTFKCIEDIGDCDTALCIELVEVSHEWVLDLSVEIHVLWKQRWYISTKYKCVFETIRFETNCEGVQVLEHILSEAVFEGSSDLALPDFGEGSP